MRHSGNRRRAFALGALLVGLAAAQPARLRAASTDTVRTCDEATLRSVIGSAKAGDTVAFGCSGTITLTGGGGGAITLSKDLAIDGSGAPGPVTISGGGSVQVFAVSSGVTVTLNDLTIANGSGFGGGISNGGTLSVTNSTITGNGTVSMSGDASGAGIYNSYSGTLRVIDSAFSNNHASGSGRFGVLNGSGGAIYNGGTLSVTGSTFSGNSAGTGSGGGIANIVSGTLA